VLLTSAEAGIAAACRIAAPEATEDATAITRALSGHPARGPANQFMRDVLMGDGPEAATLPFVFHSP
jgi:NAD(P)H-dependent flavin oxidoreductase YrpB (nitropropane dioxygenase family)